MAETHRTPQTGKSQILARFATLSNGAAYEKLNAAKNNFERNEVMR